MLSALKILIFGFLFLDVPVLSAQTLDLKVSPSGDFTILFDGAPWLTGAEVMVDKLSRSNKGLEVSGQPSYSSGKDELGNFHAITLSWVQSGHQNAELLTTTFKQYPHDPGMLTFEQHFPEDIPKPEQDESSALSARTIFPSFSRDSSSNGDDSDLACFSYHGIFPSLKACSLSSYAESHQGGSPLTIYNAKNQSLPMTVFSPLNFPKAHHMASSADFVGAGVKATVELIPKGWTQKFLLSAGLGINDGMMAWGNRMLQYTKKPRADMYKDQTHSTIGFWTDNGGFYHYSIGDNKSLGTNYEEVLPKVKAYHDSIGVPFGHWQFDSWFYPKDGGVNPGGGGGAVTNWTSLDSVFPSGMAAIQQKLQLPIVMHNRQWSTKSDYIEHMSDKYPWYVSSKAAVPQDPTEFFTWFFTQQQGWGLSMYEQDWMCTEYDEVEALQTNISLADLWLKGMAIGATSSNRSVQYCMPYPNDLLSASSYSAVTNARATGDYFHSKDQWAVGATSLFYWAIGILPFKDGFYSSTNVQTGGQTVGPEKDPNREALMATLSCAMVGPMDGIYLLNKTRTMAACRGDGVLLKPEKPVSTVDYCFRFQQDGLDPHTCYVYHTYSTIKGLDRIHYHFNNDGGRTLKPEMVYVSPESAQSYVVYNWYTGDVRRMTINDTIVDAGYEGHSYAVVSPIIGQTGQAFIGEVGKFTTASNTRFKSVVQAVSRSEGGLLVEMEGVEGEEVKVCGAQLKLTDRQQARPNVVEAEEEWELVCENAVFKSKGLMTVSLFH